MVTILSNVLEENGYKPFGCYDGKSALRRVKEIRPEVVILDYNLPDTNGLSLLSKLHKVGRDHIKGIIMASGTADPEIKKRAAKAGVFAYLSKPVDLKELLGAIKKAVNDF